MFDDYVEDGYNLMKSENELVDIYEVLAVLSIVNNEDFEKSIEFVFELFDFDNSKAIEKYEFITSVNSAIKGLCRIT